MGREKVNSKGTIAALLKYFGLFLYDTVLFHEGGVGQCVQEDHWKGKKKTIRKRSMLD